MKMPKATVGHGPGRSKIAQQMRGRFFESHKPNASLVPKRSRPGSPGGKHMLPRGSKYKKRGAK